LVVGAGAVGCVTAAALAEKSPAAVQLIIRPGQAEAVARQGLHLSGHQERRVAVQVRTVPAVPLDDALVILAVKAVDLQAALEQLRPWLRPTTTLLLLQNGYGIREAAIHAIGDTPPAAAVFRAVVAFGATWLAPGSVRFLSGKIVVDPAFQQRFPDLFTGTFLEWRESRDFPRELWKKLLVNCTVNPLSVLLQARNSEVAEPAFDSLKEAILAEGRLLAREEGIVLEIDAAFVNRYITSDNITSMLQDVHRQRPTEIEFLNGALVRLGRARGVPTPVNAFVTDLIHAIEARYGRCLQNEKTTL